MNIFLSIAIVLAGALIFASLIKRLKFPEVTAYILLGILLGPHLLNLMSEQIYELSSPISLIALGFIAFMLGENLSLENLRHTGKSILWISIFETIGACVLITAVIYFGLHQPFYVAILLGGIAPATAPAATMLVVREYRAKGSFTNTLLGVVSIDDAWGITIFAMCLSVAKLAAVPDVDADTISHEVFNPLFEILGSLLLGGIVAVTLSRASRYVSDSANLLILALSGIFLVIGISLSLGLSVLLANVALGATLVNIDRKATMFFDIVREVDAPIYVMFFVLAGTHCDILALRQLGGVGFVYMMCRMVGQVIGAFLGGYIAGSDNKIKKYLGLALFPQAGVALGMALVVKNEFPQAADTIFNLIVATTVIFEIIGPMCTRYALSRAGEITST
ncbi:MAG: cation:proton antiporter [Candidatus Brocadiales bacterium]